MNQNLGKCAVSVCCKDRVLYSERCDVHTSVILNSISSDVRKRAFNGKNVEVTINDKPITNLPLSSAYDELNRTTGRTFRMLLKAALALSENKTGYIVIVAHKDFYANDLKKQLLHIMSANLSPEYITSVIPRIITTNNRNYDEEPNRYSQCVIFEDHFTGNY